MCQKNKRKCEPQKSSHPSNWCSLWVIHWCSVNDAHFEQHAHFCSWSLVSQKFFSENLSLESFDSESKFSTWESQAYSSGVIRTNHFRVFEHPALLRNAFRFWTSEQPQNSLRMPSEWPLIEKFSSNGNRRWSLFNCRYCSVCLLLEDSMEEIRF